MRYDPRRGDHSLRCRGQSGRRRVGTDGSGGEEPIRSTFSPFPSNRGRGPRLSRLRGLVVEIIQRGIALEIDPRGDGHYLKSLTLNLVLRLSLELGARKLPGLLHQRYGEVSVARELLARPADFGLKRNGERAEFI